MKRYSIAVIGAAVLSVIGGSARADQEILIDFGNLANTPPSNYNWFKSQNAVTDINNTNQINESITGLIDSTGASTSIDAAFPNLNIVPNTNVPKQNYIFAPGNNNGGGTATPTGVAATYFDPSTTTDSWFGSINFSPYPNNASGQICDFTDARLVFSGLSPTSTYTFIVFASRIENTGDARIGDYSFTGSNSGSAALNATNNTGNVATISSITPDGTGSITMDATADAGNTNDNKFFYLTDLAIIVHTPVVAASDTWALSTGGSWNSAASWTGGIPNAQTAQANFLTNPTGLTNANAPGHITLDANQTVGQLTFNNISTYSIDPGSGTPSATLTIDDTGDTGGVNPLISVQAGSHAITAGVTLAAGVTISTSTSTSLSISGPISGFGGLIKSNPGTLTLSAVNNYAGNTSVTGGTLALTVTGAIPLKTGLTIASGATVTLTNHGANPKVVLQTSSISNSGTLNLNNNDLIAFNSAATLSTIIGQLKAGFAAGTGYWNGSAGIVSTAAAGDTRFLTTLGYAVGGNTFDGVSTSSSDVLVKYTYYGDADLNGVLNGADYHQLDLGMAGHLTGWSNGDFNYDGVVNGSDYALLDNTFNQVKATGAGALALVAGPTAVVTAVPEPATLGFAGIVAIGVMGRPRRRSGA